MASSAVVSTLQHVTDRKLSTLSSHAAKFVQLRRELLAKAHAEPDQAKRVRILCDGVKAHVRVIPHETMEPSLDRIDKFLKQSVDDPSVTPALLDDWQRTLEHRLEMADTRYRYSMLFGELLTEWIQNPNPASMGSSQGGSGASEEMELDAESFETVGRKEMHEQRKQWEKYAFKERVTDKEAIRKYLDEIFEPTKGSTKFTKTAFEELRSTMSNFDEDAPTFLDSSDVKDCIEGLLQMDLYEGTKRQSLAALKSQPEVLQEMADVLNQDLESIESWEWETNPVKLSMRKQLNGHYRVYMDEEFHQAILFQWIGARFSIWLKSTFCTFFKRVLENGSSNAMSTEMKKRRKRQAPFSPDSTIARDRRDDFMTTYFLTQLPEDEDEAAGNAGYGDDVSDDLGMGDNSNGRARSMPETKQAILRLVTTEALLNLNRCGEFVVVESDFKWFGPSLPHSTIFAVLEYLGVSKKWTDFFGKFLSPNLAFAQDGSEMVSQQRRCGIPMSHLLSTALGEAILFCLDYAVYKNTQGGLLYRFHDDLWFWGQENSCVAAWDTMRQFTQVMGLNLNVEKTGTCHLRSPTSQPRELSAKLPKGHVKWGFLKMGHHRPTENDESLWSIDMAQVDEHIQELKRQLDDCRSVFAWVRVWNSYVNNFFSNNFGHTSHALGIGHAQMCTKTFGYIQQELFKGVKQGNNVTDYLRSEIEARFGRNETLNIPDGFFYLATGQGGLELRNPFIPLCIAMDELKRKPSEYFERALEQDQQSYEESKRRWEERPGTEEPFMDWEEFEANPSETSFDFRATYRELLSAGSAGRSKGTGSPYAYAKWIEDLYGKEIVQKFGKMRISDRDLLPMGLLSMMKSEKVRWQG